MFQNMQKMNELAREKKLSLASDVFSPLNTCYYFFICLMKHASHLLIIILMWWCYDNIVLRCIILLSISVCHHEDYNMCECF